MQHLDPVCIQVLAESGCSLEPLEPLLPHPMYPGVYWYIEVGLAFLLLQGLDFPPLKYYLSF